MNIISKYLSHIAIFLISSLVYIQTTTFDSYTLDDALYIEGNDFTKRGIGCEIGKDNRLSSDCITENIKNIFGKESLYGFFKKNNTGGLVGGRYRPLGIYTFALEYEMFKAFKPKFTHVVNIFLYGFLCVSIFIFLKKIGLTFNDSKNLWYLNLPLIVTLLFALHPLHVEVVANIKGRMEMMSALGCIVTLNLLLAYVDTKKLQSLIGAILVFMLALLSKEETITMMAVIPITLFVFRNKLSILDIVKYTSIFLVPTILFFLLRQAATGVSVIEKDTSEFVADLMNDPFVDASTGEKYATIFYTWFLYLKLLIFPNPLTHDYYPKHIPIVGWGHIGALAGLLIHLVLAALAIIGTLARKTWGYTLAFYFITFSISSNLIIGIGTFMNERFMFLPSLGFVILIGLGLQWIFEKKNQLLKPLLFGIGGYLLLYTFLTLKRIPAWESNEKLFLTDIKISPNSAKGTTEAAQTIISKASKTTDKEEQKKLLKYAVELSQKAKEIHPNTMGPYDLGGQAFFLSEQYFEAGKMYSEGIVNFHQRGLLNTNLLTNLNACISQLLTQNKINEAEELLKNLIVVHKIESADLLRNYGRIQGEFKKDLDQARIYLEKSYQLEPNSYETNRFLFILNAISSNNEKAKLYGENAFRINPKDPTLINYLVNFYRSINDIAKANYYSSLLNK